MSNERKKRKKNVSQKSVCEAKKRNEKRMVKRKINLCWYFNARRLLTVRDRPWASPHSLFLSLPISPHLSSYFFFLFSWSLSLSQHLSYNLSATTASSAAPSPSHDSPHLPLSYLTSPVLTSLLSNYFFYSLFTSHSFTHMYMYNARTYIHHMYL